MGEDKDNVLEQAAEALERLDETQEIIENMAFEILNCSDSIHNAMIKLSKKLNEYGIINEKSENQAVSVIQDCLEELSSFSVNMSICAHGNEEISAKQRETMEEIKQVLDYLSIID